MKGFVLAPVVILAASCSAPGGSSGPTRSFTFVSPPGCSLEPAPSEEGATGERCRFTSDAGRIRVIHTTETAAPFGEFFEEPSRAFLREDPERFWARAVRDWEARAVSLTVEPGVTVGRAETRAFAPPPGAEACVWFVIGGTLVQEGVAGDIQGVRCALYNPAADVVEEFALEFMEFRPLGEQADPGLAADAERVVRTLRFTPPGA